MRGGLLLGLSLAAILGLAAFLVIVPPNAVASASSEASPNGLIIRYLTVSVAEEDAPKGNARCGSIVCYLYHERFDVGVWVENASNETQTYAMVIEVRKNDTTLLLAAEPVQTPPSQSERLYIPWTPEEGGDYQVRAFLLSNLESPQILSPIKTSEVAIVDTSFQGLVMIVKEGCAFVLCPAYRVEVYQNRTAIFEGNDEVAKPGRHVFEITDEQHNQLIEAFQKADFLSMNYSRIAMTDAAGFKITFNMDENRNSIYYYPFDAPEELLKLEKRIDEILGISRWVEGD